ncbi:MAG TPA: hypothetical protein VGQ58_09205 [Candidatus Limnocylindrales bacterium]|nr:hypothetical protein [Candidatus Limnocylindrales bacterium]
MNEGATTWALVVGIDLYDSADLPKLTGAAADAVAAVEWLRKLGVPEDHVFLHAVPRAETMPAVGALGIPYHDARSETIWKSVYTLQQVTGGTRLFVFLCGHGLYEPSARRLFLTQEFGVAGGYANLGIETYVRVLLSIPGFRRQFLIMDGCLNLPYSVAERQRIKEGAPVGVDMDQFTARPENSMLACFGAAQGQRVAEIEGRGAFMRRLIPAIDPARPNRDAVTLAWETGQLELDMQKVVQIVGRQVEKDGLALTPVIPQTPQPTPMGLQRLDGRYPAFTLESAKPVTLELRVNPDTAAPDLEYVKVWVDRPPFPMFYRPADGATEVTPPLVCKVPADTELRVDCTVRGGAPWQNATTLTRLKPTQDQAVVFEMIRAGGPPVPATAAPVLPLPKAAPLPPGPRFPALPKAAAQSRYLPSATTIIVPPYAQAGPSQDAGLGGEGQGPVPGYHPPMGWSPFPSAYEAPGAAEAHYKVRLVHATGTGWGGLTPHYRSIERNLGLELPWPQLFTGDESPWYEIQRGLRFQRHEDGPEFRADPAVTVAARRLVRKWAAEMREVVPDDVTVHTIVDDPTPAAPNLRLIFAGSPEDLAGPIVGRPTVRIGRPIPIKEPVWRSGEGRSLRDLGADPSIRVDPGPTEIRIDLPWGSWSRTVKAPAVREAVRVRLPERIGNPPLRVELAGARLDDGWRLMGTAGPRPVGLVLAGAGEVPLEPKRRTAGRWALGFGGDAPDAGTVELGEAARVRFPMLRKWPLAIDWSKRGLRVEPLSRIDSPEWDLLVASGRLDELRPEDGVRLTEDKWFDAILGLAGAYAVYAAADWKYLATVTGNLRRVDRTGIDVDLLAIAADRGDDAGLSEEGAATLGRLVAERQVPVMRWGVPLALELLRAADLSNSPWSRDLARIAEGLSPISTWTAWTV